MLVFIDKNVVMEKVFGVVWNFVEDKFCFKVKFNFLERKKKLCIELDIKLY